MVFVPVGEFYMGGCTAVPNSRDPDTKPDVMVKLTRAYYLDETEVTRAQWARYAASLGGDAPEDVEALVDADYPVVGVSHEAALAFAAWVGADLPTAAQWEWAAKAGSRGYMTLPYPYGSEHGIAESRLAELRYWTGLADDGPTQVARFPPNRLGLFDLAGNVAEWCRDRYGADFYRRNTGRPLVDPLCSDAGALGEPAEYVARGGSWCAPVLEMRVFHRGHRTERASDVGFRCVRETPWECTAILPGGSERPGAHRR